MAWPTAVATTGMDADTDTIPRSDILDLTTKFNALIAMRGVANGVCDLDGSGLVPNARLDAELAAIAGLTSAANKVPYFTGSGTASLLTLGVLSGNIPTVGTASATELLAGLVELATVAEAAAGIDTARAVTPAGLVAAKVIAGTSVASTSGTSIQFTGIPSWCKRITLMLSGVSTNGSSLPMVQLGDSGGIETTGYLCASSAMSTTTNTNNYTTGFAIYLGASAPTIRHGSIVLERLDAATNTWTAHGVVSQSDAAATCTIAGSKSLSAPLTQLLLTTVNGTDAFDAGLVNILYE